MQQRLALREVTKRYAGIIANEAVSLTVAPGEIHAVLGENGAGKSTLMKIIYGAIQADSGEIAWEGTAVTIANPAAARRLGIGMVYQHFSLFETVSVAENIAVTLPGRCRLPTLAKRIRELGERHGLPVDPNRLLQHLSVGERQRVEILRCLLQDPKLLILDEPTSVLAPQAVRGFFDVLRTLAAGGCSILYISHKLDEVRALCDSATILRAGRVVGTANPRSASAAVLVRQMVGAVVPTLRHEVSDVDVAPRLEVKHLSAPARDNFGTTLRDISFAVHGGEIVGIAGISGNGQSELLALLTEEPSNDSGVIALDGKPIAHLGSGPRRARGLAFVPAERLGRGTVAHMRLTDNTLLTAHSQGLLRHGFIRRRRALDLAQRIIDRFGVKCTGPNALAGNLSGGNLQKFVMGREMGLARRLLIVAQPTWGVDVAAARYLRQALIDLRREGVAILVVSEELDELFEICDRIAVMYQGRLSAAVPPHATSVEQVGLLMGGGAAASAA